MLCENCKNREATVHLSQNIDGVYSEVNLCAECLLEEFSNGELFQHFSSTKGKDKDSKVKIVILCDHCGISLDTYLCDKDSGCGKCEKSFAQFLTPLDEMTGNEKEDQPFKESRYDLREYREELAKAVRDENYEYAAILRDRIRDLDGGNKEE